jgi:NAD(P)-dependent dehydrogenase (short-subunit alcohol dehydrogenase family)
VTGGPSVAIVTGGGTGIGAATADRLAAKGYRVAVVGRREGPLRATEARIGDAGGRSLVIVADLAEPDAPAATIASVVDAWGRVDVLVNNAAVIETRPLLEMPIDVFDRHFAVNVRAPYFLVQAAVPYLRRADNACVVHVSSSAASGAGLTHSVYGASKYALEYLTRSMAMELSELGIRVNCVAPGPVDTPIHETWAGDEAPIVLARMAEGLAVPRPGTADEVAAWIVALVEPDASWMTGVVLHVDGGAVLGQRSLPGR